MLLMSFLSYLLLAFFFLLTISATKTVSLTVSISEAESISVVAQTIIREIIAFARKHQVSTRFDRERLLQDLEIFLVERNILGLEQLRVSILEDGVQVGDVVEGTRVADLIFNIVYKDRRYEY